MPVVVAVELEVLEIAELIRQLEEMVDVDLLHL
jgi:hypothetical protein